MHVILHWLVWLRNVIHATYFALMPLRVTILLVVLLVVTFGFVPQGQDALRLAGETPSTLITVMFVVSTTTLATVAWYSSRLLLTIHPATRWLTDWAPRLLGSLVFFGICADSAKAIFQYGSSIHAPWRLHFFAWAFGVLGVLFLYATFKRREWIGFAPPPPGTSLWSLVRSEKKTFFWIGLLFVVFFLAATWVPENTGLLGAPTILAFSGASLIVAGALLVHSGRLLRIPIVTCVVVLAFMFGKCNDNHVVGLSGSGDVSHRPNVVDQFKAWKATLPKPTLPNGRQPVFIVATEGGGIRAGYWTAAVLTALHDQNPGFSDHLFAISSVSGGSLGATTYAALLAAPRNAGASIRIEAKHALRDDALGPLLAGMLQPDLAQNFIPWPVLPDRAAALEGAWEHGWEARNVTGRPMNVRFWLWASQSKKAEVPSRPLFTDGFIETFDLARRRQPALFLNATVVETGGRAIVSNVKIDSWLTGKPGYETFPSSPFSSAYDALTELGGDIKISTATHLGARFPYVSPAGTIRSKHFGNAEAQPLPLSYATCVDCPKPTTCATCNRDCCHIVDGGYFEVSGAVTALEILEAIRPELGTDFFPVVLFIYAGKDPQPPYRPQQRVGEVTTPIAALFRARDGRGALGIAQLKKAAASPLPEYGMAYSFLDFRLVQRETALPLGWALAEQSRNVIDASVGLRCGPNWREFVQVQRLLDPSWKPREDYWARVAYDALPPKGAPLKPDIPLSPCEEKTP